MAVGGLGSPKLSIGRFMRYSRSILTLALLIRAVSAQSVFGVIHGVIADASGGRIVDAKLTAREVETNVSFIVLSSQSGLYEFLNVKAGTYELTAEKQGFAIRRTRPFRLEPRETR